MNESCFTGGVMAGKLFRRMSGFCDARIPSASGSLLSLRRNWVNMAASHYSFPISLSAELKPSLHYDCI